MLRGRDLDAEVALSVMGWTDITTAERLLLGIPPDGEERQIVPAYSSKRALALTVAQRAGLDAEEMEAFGPTPAAEDLCRAALKNVGMR